MVENVGELMSTAWHGLWLDTLLRGIVAFVFGLLVFLWPGLSIAVFVLFFGTFAFVDGLLMLLQSVTVKDGKWWARLIHGILGIAVGAAVFIWPGLTALVLLYIIAFYLIVGGIFQAIAAFEMRKSIKGELLLIASGILSVIVGVLMVLHPLTGAIALAQAIGLFAIAYGILLAILALRLRKLPAKMGAVA